MPSYRVIEESYGTFCVQQKTGLLLKSWEYLGLNGMPIVDDHRYGCTEPAQFKLKERAIAHMEFAAAIQRRPYNSGPKVVAWMGDKE